MKNRIFGVLLFFMAVSVYSQHKINKYKYIIVPNHFDFLKKSDQYKTSSLTKFLFNKNGYLAFLNEEKLPDDLAKNKCLALKANVESSSGFLSTKAFIVLKDCNNNVIYKSREGKSKLKNYGKSYHEAIRNAFKSVKSLRYSYTPAVKKVVAESKMIKNSSQIENKNSNTEITLYAQSIKNGFQLVNSEPKIIFQIINVNIKNVFIIKDRNGVLYKNNTNWIAEYYKDGKKFIEQYKVKF